jgi:hypothetical protein
MGVLDVPLRGAHGMRAILIAGTNGWQPDATNPEWFQPGSAFARFLESNTSIRPVFGPDGTRPFTWSTDLGGVGFGKGDLRVWQSGGVNLYAYAVPPLAPDARIPSSDLILIAHSHGLQVALCALAYGLKADRLISIGSPIRKDMEAITAKARPNVRHWLHVHSDGSDRWQWIGELFDGGFRIRRDAPLADRNDFVANVGHSELLRNPANFHFWLEKGWV